MRISELSAASGVSVGTIKYYLREGLLPPGERTSRTSADYGAVHLERLRLIRALVEQGGLGIEAVRRVVAAVASPRPDRLDLLAAAQDAYVAARPPHRPGASGAGQDAGRARAWLRRRGWAPPDERGPAEDPLTDRLEEAWAACERAGVELGEDLLDAYADAVEQLARADVASVPQDPAAAVHRVVVGTVMTEPVLAVLRLLAQRAVAAGFGPPAQDPPSR